jgi:uncharacterized protein UPF0259
MTANRRGELSARRVAREMWSVYRRHWTFLVPAALVVLLPQALADGVLDGFHVEGIKSAQDVALLGGALLTAAVNLMGQAVYAGLTAAAVVDWRAGQPLPPLSALLRSMPLRRLVVLDVLITVLAAIGFVLLVVPALVFLTYVAISPAIMKLEHLGVLAAIRRSIELVRGRARRVFAIVVGAVLFTELAVQAIVLPFHGLALLIAANLVAEGIFQPIEGLAIALVAIHLLELHGEAPAPSVMARALVGEAD